MAYAKGLSAAQYVGLLKADFAGLDNLDEIVNKTLYRLMVRDYRSSAAAGYGVPFSQWKNEGLQETGGFADMVRNELGRTLGIVRNKARAKARGVMNSNKGESDRGVSYGVWKNSIGGSIGILDTKRGRLESRSRAYAPKRGATDRTIQVNSYYGRDRAFILRMINSGTDVRVAENMNGHGILRSSYEQRPSMHNKRAGIPFKGNTIGRRGAITGRNWFSTVNSDLEQEAAKLGMRMERIANEILETAYNEI